MLLKFDGSNERVVYPQPGMKMMNIKDIRKKGSDLVDSGIVTNLTKCKTWAEFLLAFQIDLNFFFFSNLNFQVDQILNKYIYLFQF